VPYANANMHLCLYHSYTYTWSSPTTQLPECRRSILRRPQLRSLPVRVIAAPSVVSLDRSWWRPYRCRETFLVPLVARTMDRVANALAGINLRAALRSFIHWWPRRARIIYGRRHGAHCIILRTICGVGSRMSSVRVSRIHACQLGPRNQPLFMIVSSAVVLVMNTAATHSMVRKWP
jgi:hypothetical protein